MLENTTEQSTLTHVDVVRMVETLEWLHDETGRFLEHYGDEPRPGSPASLELGSYPEQDFVQTAYSQGSILIEVSADHMMALAKTLTEPAQSVAPWTCLRGVLESAALAVWLLDPSLTVKSRVQRSFAFRFKGLEQQAKIGRISGDTSLRDNALQRIDSVEESALRLGFSKQVNQRGRRIGIAQQMPSITDLVRETLHDEPTYRLLSAMAHAHPFAVQQLGYRSRQSLEGPHLEKHLLPISVLFLCTKAVETFAQPIVSKCCLFGWDVTRCKALFQSAFSVVRPFTKE